MSGTYDVEMGDRGRLVVPAELRRDLGWESGTRLHLIETPGGVVMMTTRQLRDHVRGEWSGRGAGLLDELLAERRRNAVLEAEETAR